MKKTPTIFLRDFGGNPALVTREPNPDAEWVFSREGVATRKYDGTCCMFDGAAWWKRREVKAGKPTPEDFVGLEVDRNTGKRVGWVPIHESDKWHLRGIENTPNPAAGTYELCGPKVQGNPEGFEGHIMVGHADAEQFDVPRDWDGLSEWLADCPYEGLVFHHPDGRMAKIKRRDFGHK